MLNVVNGFGATKRKKRHWFSFKWRINNRICICGMVLFVRKTRFENQKRPSPEGESRYILS